MQPYDEIQDAAVSIAPYQNFISETKDRVYTVVSGKREGDPDCMVPLTDVYNTNNTDKQSLLDTEKQMLENDGYLILQADDVDVAIEESTRKGSSDVPVKTSIRDLYAVVQKKRYPPSEPLLRDQPQSQTTDNFAQSGGNKPEQLNDKQTTVLAESIGIGISEHDDTERQDGMYTRTNTCLIN